MSNTSVSPNSILKYSAASLTSSVDGKSVTRRLQTELQMLMQSKAPGISAFPENDNLFRWIGTIAGPVTTVYEGLSFKLGIKFSSSYPYNPPSVVFESPMFHPNVDEQGNICLDILKDKWSAVYNAETILLSVQSLLGEPNISSPLNGVAADLWSNPTEFKRVLWQKCNTQPSSSCS